MPTQIRILDRELKQQAPQLTQYEFPSAFYAENGFEPAASLVDTAHDWLAYSDHIYFNGECLTDLVKQARVDNLQTQVTQHCAVDDEAVKIKRLNAWNLLMRKIVGEEVDSTLVMTQRFAWLLKVLEESEYATERNLKRYQLTDDTVAQQEMSDTLVMCNLILQSAFDYLSPRNEASLVEGFSQIIRNNLLKFIEPEQSKKALIQSLLTYAYRGGVFQALYRAHVANIKPGYSLNTPNDLAQTTIEFKSQPEGIVIKEQTPISEVLSENSMGQSFRPSRHEEKEEKSHEGNSLSSISVSDSDKPARVLVPAPTLTDTADATEIPLNIIETSSTTEFALTNPGKVVIKPLSAVSSSCKTKTVALNVVVDRWWNKLSDMSAYASNYIKMQKHNQQMQQILFDKYPELVSEQSNKQEWRWLALFSTTQAVHGKGDKIFSYLGRNAPNYARTQVFTELELYAYKGENEYTYAIKLLRRLGASELVKLALEPYLKSNAGQVAESTHDFMKEAYVRKAYRFMKGHTVYLVFQLLPEMQFANATVLTQSPPKLLQFDNEGEHVELARGKELVDDLPAFKAEYFTKLRALQVCEFIKPFLDEVQLKELQAVIDKHNGVALNAHPEFFKYPLDRLERPNNLLNLNEKQKQNGLRHG